MKKIKLFFPVGIIPLVLFWYSCNKPEKGVSPPLPGNEPLTTMKVTAVNVNDSKDTVSATWAQLDPTGAAAPVLTEDTLRLKSGTTYNVVIKVLDTLTDITPEIKARENYHLFCFSVSGGLNLSCVQTDLDTNPKPLSVGLTDQFTTGSGGNGGLEVTLHHQPNVKNGSCDPGSTDLDATFTVLIN